MKPKTGEWRFEVALFGGEIHLFVCAYDRFIRRLEARYDRSVAATVGAPSLGKAFAISKPPPAAPQTIYVLWLPPALPVRSLVSSLTHECYHTAVSVLRDTGVTDVEAMETHAYLLSWLVEQCWRRIFPG